MSAQKREADPKTMAIMGLISCVSRKHDHPCAACDLYTSPLFLKAREYAERRCDAWYVLSAKHGLVSPDQVIAPYEETLNTKSREERERWAEEVWSRLCPRLKPSDRVVVLAGRRYREFLVPMLAEFGCHVEVPMEGLGIGRQLRWLSALPPRTPREDDLDRLYDSLRRLEYAFKGKRLRLLHQCRGKQDWPQRGVYLFFEPSEHRSSGAEARVVRVGTHAVSRGSKATFWSRLRAHRGTGHGLGNHRGSIFRLHVGAALARKDPALALPTWAIGQSADAETRKKEERLERLVSTHIGSMSVLWLDVGDDAGPTSDRAYLERNIIGLLSGKQNADPPSTGWLGLFSPDERIRNSGLWNLGFLDHAYSPDFLDVLDEYVLITIGKKPRPAGAIAPREWCKRD